MEATRFVFGKEILEIAKTHDDFVVCNADTKACGIEAMGDLFPTRSYSIGIAEQNLINVAAGLAAEDFKVFACTFAVFVTMRCCEQVRNFICYPHLNVTVVGTHTGLQVGEDGATHAAVEDVAIMRAFPNMTIIQPADAVAAKAIAHAAHQFHGPLYVRLHRNPSPLIYDESYTFELGKATRVLNFGDDVALISSGIMLQKALDAAGALKEKGIKARVIDMSTLKPLDEDAVLEAARATNAIVTIEDHSLIGGLGSAVTQLLSEKHPCHVKCIGIPDVFGESGPSEVLYAKHRMDVPSIVAAAEQVVAKKR
ncbi:transketolase family protein [Propionivibrio dicarboxylicus]|uniref:Transketolase n=1 Tax=Propionivibrio dicarboxylicus TaxID=83767 RepID=A0A1G8HTJ3_9RHOO|nr:transketolase C-terminal domain-containing protein [Propionivibrio dicarboxylicus]SDI09800.1 transketolase [Propionivibrio dicarboxylicus]